MITVDWAPLEGLARAVPDLDPDEFMCMGLCLDEGHPPLWQYKHVDIRSFYLNLDEAGHAWEHYVATLGPGGDLIDFDPHLAEPFRSVDEAMAGLRRYRT